jgi:AcrR family transcriptional regulator
MARSAAQTRRRILQTAYGLFYRRGFARVGVDQVAAHAGLTKRTLYNHFRSKDELLAAVLEFHGELALGRIREFASGVSGARDPVTSLFDELARWATKPRWSGAGFTRLVMELADLPGHPARGIARRHKAAVEAWFAKELAKRSVKSPADRARQVMVLLEGAMALMLIHGDRRYADDAAKAARELIAREDR